MPNEEAKRKPAQFLAESMLEGRVTGPDGLAVEGAVVWLYPKFRWHVFFKGCSDAVGRFRVEGIWSDDKMRLPDWGEYTLGIKHNRFAMVWRNSEGGFSFVCPECWAATVAGRSAYFHEA